MKKNILAVLLIVFILPILALSQNASTSKKIPVTDPVPVAKDTSSQKIAAGIITSNKKIVSVPSSETKDIQQPRELKSSCTESTTKRKQE
jgi:hypothetical protein